MHDLSTPSSHARQVDVPGGRMFVHCQGGGPSVALLLHGLGDDHTVFPRPVIDDLARDHRVLIPDLLGFGVSLPSTDFDFTMDSQVAAIEVLLEHLDVTAPPLLIGHSMGGGIATLVAARRVAARRAAARRGPVGVAALVSAEGNLGSNDGFISEHATRAAARGRFDEWWRLFPAAVERQNGATPAIRRYLAALGRTSAEAFLATCHSLHECTVSGAFAAAYRDLAAPRLYCHGDGTPPDTLEFLTRHGLPTHHFPGAPHWLIEHDPEGFIAAVRGFH